MFKLTKIEYRNEFYFYGSYRFVNSGESLIKRFVRESPEFTHR